MVGSMDGFSLGFFALIYSFKLEYLLSLVEMGQLNKEYFVPVLKRYKKYIS